MSPYKGIHQILSKRNCDSTIKKNLMFANLGCKTQNLTFNSKSLINKYQLIFGEKVRSKIRKANILNLLSYFYENSI